MREPVDHELGLFRATPRRAQPRDKNGRFVRVRYSAERLKILAVARELRAKLGLPPSPLLMPFGVKEPEQHLSHQPTNGGIHG